MTLIGQRTLQGFQRKISPITLPLPVVNSRICRRKGKRQDLFQMPDCLTLPLSFRTYCFGSSLLRLVSFYLPCSSHLHSRQWSTESIIDASFAAWTHLFYLLSICRLSSPSYIKRDCPGTQWVLGSLSSLRTLRSLRSSKTASWMQQADGKLIGPFWVGASFSLHLLSLNDAQRSSAATLTRTVGPGREKRHHFHRVFNRCYPQWGCGVEVVRTFQFHIGAGGFSEQRFVELFVSLGHTLQRLFSNWP